MPYPPVTQSNISNQWSASFFTVILTVNELSDTYYTIDGSSPINSLTRVLYTAPFVIEEQGVTAVNYFSISHLTLLSNLVKTEYVKIDNGAPVTSVVVSIEPDGASGWYITEPTITLSAIDSVSEVDKTYYAWDGASFQEYTVGLILTIPNEGIHYLQFYSIDKASNKEEIQTKIFKYDRLTPTTSIQIPLATSYQPVTIKFIASDGASGYNTTYYTTDGSNPTTESDSGSSFEIKDPGLYTVKYFSIDNAGNAESIKTSNSFRIQTDSSTLQVLLAESFPINGNNGWYRSSPQISVLTTKPHLITSLKYKVSPKNIPTTATYTSTVEITGTIDLSQGSFIALEIDKSGQPLVFNIRGTDSTKTSIQDIIDKINDTFGGDVDIAKQTGADGLEGTGYITITSPTAGTGSSQSEIKFVSPGTYDATPIVFGLSIDFYPHTFTETYLYQNYTVPFILPSDGEWNVTAIAETINETTQVSKDYSLDSDSPITNITVTPGPNLQGFYTTSPDITFSVTEATSGVYRTIYQFDNGPVFEYHPEDGPIHLPNISGQITLVYYSVDIAGNTESLQEYYFNYDFIPPTTVFDINAINLDTQNILDILFVPAQIVEYNPYTNSFEFNLTPTQRENLSRFAGWTSDLNSRIYDTVAPVEFTVDITTNVLTILPLYTLYTKDVIRVSSTGTLPDPLVVDTDYYVIEVSDTKIKLATSEFNAGLGIAIDITTEGGGVRKIIPANPTIVVYDPLRIHLYAVDDREYLVNGETVIDKDIVNREITVQNGFLKHVIRIFNQTTAQQLTYRYYSNDKIYIVEEFLSTDTIVVDYVYTKIVNTYYTTNGTQPTTLSSQGHIIDLVKSGSYTLKWFSVDEAGNHEAIKTFSATIVIINRAPTVDVNIVKHNDIGTNYTPNGDNGWYKRDLVDTTLRPAIKVDFDSPDVEVFNENSIIVTVLPIPVPPYDVELRVLRVDSAIEKITSVTRVDNLTQGQSYIINSFSGDRIFVTAPASPALNDVLSVDYTFDTILNTALTSRLIKIGDPDNPDVVVDFSTDPTPFVYELPNGYNIQGEKQITVIVNDLRSAQTTIDSIPELTDGNPLKLDTFDPSTVDDAVSGWVNTNVTVTLTAQDYDTLPPDQSESGVNRIYYSTDGSAPTLYVLGNVANVLLTDSGEYVVKYRAKDNAGNLEIIKSSSLVQIDKSAPETSVVVVPPDGTNGWYKTSPSIVLSAIDLHSGIFGTYYKWDDGVYSLYSASLLIPSEGIHTLHFYSVDNVGNQELVKSHQFKLDATAPATIDDITGNWTNNATITLTSVDVASGTYRIYYTLALTSDPCPDPTLLSPYTETLKVTAPTNGIYNFKYFAVDYAGNIEAVKTVLNQFYVDLTKPVIVSVDPPDLIFTTETHLTVDLIDTYSGVNVNTVKVFVDDIEYSTSKNSSFFTYSGTPFALQVQVGPIASIVNFDRLESAIIYANDFAGNSAIPVVIRILPVDTEPPYVRQFWPKNGAKDVSRETNVMFFIDDDVSGVDIRTVVVNIANTEYKLTMLDVIDIIYTGVETDVFINIINHMLYLTVGGIIVGNINLTTENYSTIKKVATFIDSIANFEATVINRDFDQLSSLDLINLYNIQIDPNLTLSIARFEDNKNINFMPRDRGYLIAVTPSTIFDDNFIVNTTISASDFSGHQMTIDSYSFTCKDITTPPRSVRDKWYDLHTKVLSRIKKNLESTYTRQSDSTVFAGYFRQLALEIARAEQLALDCRDDIYYDGGTTRPELLYQNLGYMLNFQPQLIYSHNEYREILLALLSMFLKGSTKESILEGLSIFLGVYGLTADENSIKENFNDISQQFTFSFDVTIGSTPIKNWTSFNDTLYQILNMVKPAHTSFLIRYLFAEIIHTQNIQDEIIKWDSSFTGTEDVRTNCEDKYKIAEIITENVSSQFTGSNNCCVVFWKPILDWAETTITMNPLDVQVEVTPPGTPISVISVNGFTGEVCLSRNPLVTEQIEIVYKFNKFVIYRQLSFYLNTYTIIAGNFDSSRPYLLNQTGQPVDIIIAYDIPEELHAHICETGIFIDANLSGLQETFDEPTEQIKIDATEFKQDIYDVDIAERYNIGVDLEDDATILQPIEKLVSCGVNLSESTNFLTSEYGVGIEQNPDPFLTNDAFSITNDLGDILYYAIQRFF